jgi:hypothetical protein
MEAAGRMLESTTRPVEEIATKQKLRVGAAPITLFQ